MDMFESAIRQKLRFETSKGLLSLEDLWDLPLTSAAKVSLDAIALDLHQQLQSSAGIVSFVDESAAQNPVVKLRFDLVKHVIDQRKKENAEAANARVRAETKQQLLAALQKKRESAVDLMSEEDLLKKLADL